MEDSTDTVIVTGIGKDIKKEDFVNHFKRIGNIIRSNMRTERSDGIVTYADSKMAKQAAEDLNDSNLKGSVINVFMADRFYNQHPGRRDHTIDDEINTAWALWLRENKWQHGDDVEQRCGGGKGGKGGRGGPNVPSGHDGEDGEPGPGGKGGAGGKPAVPSIGNNGWQNDRNNGHGGGGGKGGKGGCGGPNVPSGHDGEDGEPGPGGKGGAGGKPAVSNASLGKRPYNWNWSGNNDPWYTRWFGIGGRGKEGGNDKRPPIDNDLISRGGGKGGKGGKGSYGIKSGHDGEDGESGPFGKGGKGGKPAL